MAGLGVRTNNAVERFHAQLQNLVGRRHPNFWMFFKSIQRVELSKTQTKIGKGRTYGSAPHLGPPSTKELTVSLLLLFVLLLPLHLIVEYEAKK